MTASFMRRALELAERGRGRVHPNPLVGAVVVRDGRIVGEGCHARFGGPHAEVEAIRDAESRSPGACRGASIHVSLEPCAHQGKTPPCTDAILAAGFAEVVYAMEDPNPKVAGRGHRRLEEAGVRVTGGVEREAARLLDEAYVHYHETGRPHVTWKIALTLDHCAALVPGRRSEITGAEARDWSDDLRARVDAVVVGAATALVDDPGLRVRHGRGRDPRRVVVDADLRVPADRRLFAENGDRLTILATAADADEARLAPFRDLCDVVAVPRRERGLDLDALFRLLAERGLIEILVESGGGLGAALMRAGLVDRLAVLTAPRWAGRAARPVPSPLDEPARARFAHVERLGDDLLSVVDLR